MILHCSTGGVTHQAVSAVLPSALHRSFSVFLMPTYSEKNNAHINLEPSYVKWALMNMVMNLQVP